MVRDSLFHACHCETFRHLITSHVTKNADQLYSQWCPSFTNVNIEHRAWQILALHFLFHFIFQEGKNHAIPKYFSSVPTLRQYIWTSLSQIAKKECSVFRTRVYRTANKERWINKVSSHSLPGQWGRVEKNIPECWKKSCILLRTLSDGLPFIGWLLILHLILRRSAYRTQIIERYFFPNATTAKKGGGR